MTEPDIAVLDVGHGSCALITDGAATIVVDAPQRTEELLQALDDRDIADLDAVLVSHSDNDHVGGLATLLTQPDLAVDRVYYNADAARRSRHWVTLQQVIRHARRVNPELSVHVELTTSNTGEVDTDRLRIEVLAPTPELAMSGVGGRSPAGRAIRPNTMSAVVRLTDGRSRGVLLMGDLDATGFDELVGDVTALDADVLVFPHHGGDPGGPDARCFARRVTEAVGPETVIVSVSRTGPSARPDTEIVMGVLAGAPNVHVACTQLSKDCAHTVREAEDAHLSDLPSRGRITGHCCAGTVEFRFTETGIVAGQLPDHAMFVSSLESRAGAGQRPLCRRRTDGWGGAFDGRG